MLPRVNRLKKNREFKRVFKKGRSFREDFLILKAIPSILENSRFGLVVSSKVSKKASFRNKIKRWLRAAILSQLKKNHKIRKPADIVIIVNPGASIKNFQEVQGAIDRLLKLVFGNPSAKKIKQDD